MNRKKRVSPRKSEFEKLENKGRKSLVGFVLIGFLHDVFFVLKGIRAIIGWPVHAAAKGIHKAMRHYPAMHFKHSRSIICGSIGVALLAASFAVEHWYHGPLWLGLVEGLRAVGACPVWDVVSGITKVGAEFEG